MRRILSHGTQAKINALINAAEEITRHYSTRFQGTASTIGRRAASQTVGTALGGFNVPGQVASTAINAAADASFALVKIAQASRDFKAEMRTRILAEASQLPGSRDMMAAYLAMSSDMTISSNVESIMEQLTVAGFMTSPDELDYQHCGRLDPRNTSSLNLGVFNSTRNVLFADCYRVAREMGWADSDAATTGATVIGPDGLPIDLNHASARSYLQQSLFQTFRNSLLGIFTVELVHPLMNIPASFVAGAASEALAKHIANLAHFSETKADDKTAGRGDDKKTSKNTGQGWSKTQKDDDSQSKAQNSKSGGKAEAQNKARTYADASNRAKASKAADNRGDTQDELAEETPIHKPAKRRPGPSVAKAAPTDAIKDAKADKRVQSDTARTARPNKPIQADDSSSHTGYRFRRFVRQASYSAASDTQDPSPIYNVVTAESGNTVDGIARSYGCTTADIIEANPWLQEEGRIHGDYILIHPGEMIVVPGDTGYESGSVSGGRLTNVDGSREPGVLEVLRLAEGAYVSKYRADDIGKSINQQGGLTTKFLKPVEVGGLKAYFVELTYPDGSKALTYNIAGMSDTQELGGIAEFVKDIPNAAAAAFSGRAAGRALAATYDWDQIPDRVQIHINEIEAYRQETKDFRPIIINGHSNGGFDGIGVGIFRPDLVQSINLINSPGTEAMINQFVSDSDARASLVTKMRVYNSDIEPVNNWGTHPSGTRMYHIVGANEHNIGNVVAAYNTNGLLVEVTPGFYRMGAYFDDATGAYTVRSWPDTTREEMAQKLGISVTRVEQKQVFSEYTEFTVKPVYANNQR